MVIKMKKYFLFDLDGTVTDTGEGIVQSAQYALDAFGIHNEPRERLYRFVGPPLDWSFREFYGFSQEKAWQAVEKYREYYREKGVFESPLYPGMRNLLDRLSQEAAVCLATSKPLHFARQILELRDAAQFFTVMVGSNLDGSMTDKGQVIGEALRQLGDPPKAEAVMIGDRRQDILGAKSQGVESIGVKYGYAEENELEEAGAVYTVPTVEALEELCFQLLGR